MKFYKHCKEMNNQREKISRGCGMAKKCRCRLIVFCLVLSMVIVTPAYAYLDPGTGSAILQGLLAVLAMAIVVVKVYWQKILVFLGIRKKAQDSESKSADTKV